MKLHNQKGVILIIALAVILMLMGLSATFFMRVISQRGLSQRQSDSLKAFYNAEKALSYAYFESAAAGWNWFTHDWDADNGDDVPLSSPPASLRAGADTYFIAAGADQGCYAANDGSFILKAFADPQAASVTLVRAKGISGSVERVLEYRITRTAIYDFAWWTPYSLNINNVGENVNGGRIHSNGNIYMYNSKRLYGVDTISTGKNKGVYYVWDNYYGPGYYDYYMDGSSNINGEVPIPDLGKPDVSIPGSGTFRRWAGTTSAESTQAQSPWLYYYAANDKWYYRSYGSAYAGQWPPRDWSNEESFFYGNSEARYNSNVGGKILNTFNTWIYPVKKDSDGNIIFDSDGKVVQELPEQIPAELEGAMWDWTKYDYYGNFGGAAQNQLKFTVYDPAGGTKYVEDTRWAIVINPLTFQKEVKMVDPALGGSTYWEMLQNVDYWKALGYSAQDAQSYATHINPEILDGTYGSELSAGQKTIQVDNTNSMKQAAAWNNFLVNKGLDDVVMANEQGEDMEAPRFATTYKEKCRSAGIYLSKSGGTHTLHYGDGTEVAYTAENCGAYNPANPGAYQECLEKSIDVLVERINTGSAGSPLPANKQAAKKAKFINTYTNKWSVVLELDIDKMKRAKSFPANGIVYSEVPIRLANAKELPYISDPKKATFNVIGEENIYLKGDYNDPASNTQWMPSAIISKKHIYTLSRDFNDPQVSPAFVNYPNYPYVYVKTDPAGNFIEADPKGGEGSWVYYGSYYSTDPKYTQALNLMNAINSDWRSTFDKSDSTGSNTYTVSSSHPIIDGQTWGALPNRVQNNHTYNALFASYYYGYQYWSGGNPAGSLPYGVNLERWINNGGSTRSKTTKGAYFQLEWGNETDPDRFTAHQSDGPLDFYYYAGFDYRPSSREPGSPVYSYDNLFLSNYPNFSCSYDSRFRNPSLAQNRPIFFGGGSSSWREIPTVNF
ncbi:MAG: hypothetical protein V1699_06345 [Candidatus Omnitrophota bacterium]